MRALTIFYDNHKENQDDFEDRHKSSVADYNTHNQASG